MEPTILVVDDDAINRLILQKLFEKENNTVKTAQNGCEAMQLLNDESDFNIVITDIMMPEMDGIELARRATDPAPRLRSGSTICAPPAAHETGAA